MFDPPVDPNSKSRLTAIRLDEASIKRGNTNIEHEREVAIFDILEANRFELDGRDDGPYTLDPLHRRGSPGVRRRAGGRRRRTPSPSSCRSRRCAAS